MALEIIGHFRWAIIDSEAKYSIARSTLTKLLLEENIPNTSQYLTLTLADGKERQVKTYKHFNRYKCTFACFSVKYW